MSKIGGKRHKYELWIDGVLIYSINEWYGRFKSILTLREIATKQYPGKEFQIFYIAKSKLSKVAQEEEPKPKTPVIPMQRPPATYSNHSPYKIAR